MNVFAVNPYTRAVTPASLPDGKLESIYAAMRALDPHFSGTVDIASVGVAVALVVDDVGFLSEGRPVFALRARNNTLRYFAGAALLVGDRPDGDFEDCPLTLLAAQAPVEFPPLETTGDFGPTTTHETEGAVHICMDDPIFRPRAETRGLRYP